MNTDFLIEKSVQIRQIRVIRVPNHGNSQRAFLFSMVISLALDMGFGGQLKSGQAGFQRLRREARLLQFIPVNIRS